MELQKICEAIGGMMEPEAEIERISLETRLGFFVAGEGEEPRTGPQEEV